MRPHRWKPTRLPFPWDSPGKNTGVGCHVLLQCMKAKSESEVAQSCPTLRDPMDCSLPGSSVHGIFQARVLEWGAIAFSVHPFREDQDPTPRLKYCFFWLFLPVSASPSFPIYLFKPAPWNSGKVLEAEWSLFSIIKEGETQKGFSAPEPHRVLVGTKCGRNLKLSHSCLEELWLIKCFNSKMWHQTPLPSQIVSCSSWNLTGGSGVKEQSG